MSQGALGAAAAMCVARRGEAREAALLGALAGMAPDLDVLVRSASDPLLFLEAHRQFTHSFAFVPIGSGVCAVLGRLLLRRRLAFLRVWWLCAVAYATHGLLDACTSYGTQLLWPFSDARIAWNVIAVVDPLFTLPLLGLVGFASKRRDLRLARVGLAWALAVLTLGVTQRERAELLARSLARERGHRIESLQVKPAFANLLLWKSIYAQGDRYHVDALRMGLEPRVYPGESVHRLELARDLPTLARDSVQARDLERFRWFSSGYVALDPERADRVIDVRYSLVPNEIQALWGIRLELPGDATTHARFFTDRAVRPEQRRELLRMLKGE